MDSPLKWILNKISPVKMQSPAPIRESSSKEKKAASPKKRTTPEKKIKKVRVLEARSRAPLF